METNLINYSFCDHKPEFSEFLHVIEDQSDFWKFVNKYETMLRKAGQPILKEPLPKSERLLLQPYHKCKFIPFGLQESKPTTSTEEKFSTFGSRAKESKEKSYRNQQFIEIVLTYLDFKQKEKFKMIKKLRKSQKSLPIAKFKTRIKETLEQTQVLIIAGDTGCGKSTQVPQFLLDFGYKSIACTQPRRLACVSLSKRVSHELLDDYGNKVGFQIRFEKSKTSKTNVVFITEGLLLRQLAAESNLNQYDVLILDEVHERNLFGDFLLGVTKCLLRANPAMKLILMSATINVNLFYSYFQEENAQLLEVPGRLYPIKTLFMPPPSLELSAKDRKNSKTNRLDPGPFIQVLSLIDEKYTVEERGDALIFVSGVNEITTVIDAIKEYAEQNNHWIVLPLHSGLALTEQDKVFDYAPDGMRKCIVSTNIAETSLTVDGIRFVIDSGKVKEMSYDANCKGQRLKEFFVSKSSADQRKGRAGRTGPGVCFRLFSEKQYASFEDFPTPEIFRVPLDAILLQMIAMGLPNVRIFPFIQSPSEESVERTILSLKQHNALTPAEKITPLGKALSNLPVDVTIGKMLLMGCVFPYMEKILTLCASLSVQNPFTNRAYTDRKCEQARSELETDQGDIFTLLRSYKEWLHMKLNNDNTRQWCHKLGIEEQRFYEITKLRAQFQNILENCDMIAVTGADVLTSAERARRHGEVRMLKAIKRRQKFQEPRNRKMLKRGADSIEPDFEGEGEDIRDVDLRLRNDSVKLRVLLESAIAESHRDVTLLKLILVSGFYPQIAIADEYNYCKSGSQQFFHTFLKPYISMHPNSYFAKFFDILKLNDSDIIDKPDYYTPKQVLSRKHQVLCYQSLLETAKPYLMNCIRMPAAQTLLLFSYIIDTNESVTRVVCDSWICLDFPIPETGYKLLSWAMKLRNKWTNRLTNKLNEANNKDEYAQSKAAACNSNENDDDEFCFSLADYMASNVAYTIKRLLPADLKALYNHSPLSDTLQSNPFDKNYGLKANDEKGGVFVSDNVCYGCVQEVKWTIDLDHMLNKEVRLCNDCGLEMDAKISTKIFHKSECKENTKMPTTSKKSSKEIQQTAVPISAKSTRSSYTCSICHKEVKSQIDLLKHQTHCKKV